ncbi:hypothetical protein Noda2021_11580 [Candidatus Dependentiae bacterium Noda2021]|nr:hypothetical protein Noda2021_11580 [Candidatus Dependentiae bacterium Noda2021]
MILLLLLFSFSLSAMQRVQVFDRQEQELAHLLAHIDLAITEYKAIKKRIDVSTQFVQLADAYFNECVSFAASNQFIDEKLNHSLSELAHEIGFDALMLNDVGVAIKHLSFVVDASKNDKKYFSAVALGRLYLLSNNPKVVKKYLIPVLDSSHTQCRAAAYFLLGQVYENTKTSKALEYFNQAAYLSDNIKIREQATGSIMSLIKRVQQLQS